MGIETSLQGTPASPFLPTAAALPKSLAGKGEKGYAVPMYRWAEGDSDTRSVGEKGSQELEG